MKKGLITLGIIGFLLFLLAFSGCGSYNNMVQKEENVTQKWQEVENQYQRRMDLIPNLVNTVQGYADFEKSTLTSVIEARSKATSVNINAENLDAASMQRFQQAQGELSGALSRLLVVAEQYPNLKANENFMDLQKQLEGTENRITFGRTQFNEAAQDYNTYIRKFPRNIWAGLFNFDKKAYFESEAGAEKAPRVKFDTK